MAKAHVKDGVLYIETPFVQDGKATASGKNTIHATTEAGTLDALTITVAGKQVTVQVNAYSRRTPKQAPATK